MLNHILKALGPDDGARISASLELVTLTARQQLETPGRPIGHVYFFETGVAAVMSVSNRRRIAIGLIGCEGASGISVFLGDDRSPHATVMLSDGTAGRIAVRLLRSIMNDEPELKRILLRYASAFFNQAAHTALSNAMSLIEQRVARWLLMAHDRVPSDEVPLTHELTAEVLGVRRAGITEALDKFQEERLVRLVRGGVVLLDREGLKKTAGPFYGLPEKEYVRLVGTYWPPVAPERR
jgi:CRP-like cAMP-binding protein